MRETLEQISSLFKGPIEEPTNENNNQSTSSSRKPIRENRVSYELAESVEKIPKVRYKLRGVSTQSNVIYVLSPVEPNDSSSGDTPTDASQWWRVEYSYASAQPYITREVRMRLLAVYASEILIYCPISREANRLISNDRNLPKKRFLKKRAKNATKPYSSTPLMLQSVRR